MTFTAKEIKPALFVIFILALTGAVATENYPKFFLASSASLDYRLFLRNGPDSAAEAKQGSYIKFHRQDPIIQKGKNIAVGKKLTCDEGHVLRVEWPYYYCDGQYLGIGKEKGQKGQKVPKFIHNGSVPKGKAFVSGSHAFSYDSRYWGFLEKSKIEEVMTPIL